MRHYVKFKVKNETIIHKKFILTFYNMKTKQFAHINKQDNIKLIFRISTASFQHGVYSSRHRFKQFFDLIITNLGPFVFDDAS